jgi:hypothetical protein
MKYVYEVITRYTIECYNDDYWTTFETIAIFDNEKSAINYKNNLIENNLYDEDTLVIRKSEIGKETDRKCVL